jgi:aminopeptidase N
VTYRETALLVSDDSREANSEQAAVKTVAHELAHQWFGDIVTMQWWDGQQLVLVQIRMQRPVQHVSLALFAPLILLSFFTCHSFCVLSSGLWLNEGFARFVEYIGLEAYDSTWDAATQRIVNAQGAALALDSSQYSHAIVQAVSDPREIGALFDSISYVSIWKRRAQTACLPAGEL